MAQGVSSVSTSTSRGAIPKILRPPPVSAKPLPSPLPHQGYVSTPRHPVPFPECRPPMPQPVPSPILSLMSIKTTWLSSWGLPRQSSRSPKSSPNSDSSDSPRPTTPQERPASRSSSDDSLITYPTAVRSPPSTRPLGYPQISPIPAGSPFLWEGCRKCGSLAHEYEECWIKKRRCFWCGRWGVDVRSCPLCSRLSFSLFFKNSPSP